MPELNFTPAELRRIADILESNSDQRGFDFWSAVAAMEGEEASADNTGSVLDTIEAFLRDMETADLVEFGEGEQAEIKRAFHLLRAVADGLANTTDPTT